MNPFARVFQWVGGALFVGALAFCVYSFLIAWSGAVAFNGPAILIDGILFTAFAAHHSVEGAMAASVLVLGGFPAPRFLFGSISLVVLSSCARRNLKSQI